MGSLKRYIVEALQRRRNHRPPRNVTLQLFNAVTMQLPSQLDRVTLHFVIKRRALDAEDLGGLLFVAVTLGQRLDDGVALQVVEILDASVRVAFALLQP